jgi:DUF1009 family protein
MREVIGLISGEGEFPLILAKSLKNKGYSVIAVCFSKEQEKKLETLVSKVYRIKIGQFGKLIKIFKNEGVKKLLFLGKIDKINALKVGIPDLRALSLWRRIKIKEDDAILRAVAEELEKEGFCIEAPSQYLTEFLTPEGVLTKRKPGDEEWEDIKYGVKIAKAIGDLDIGQCVVVKDRMTIAVEAIEGTDATILRAGSLRKNTVVIKVAKPKQDLRLDLPVAGKNTVETMIKARAKVLVLEAGKTFFLQREEAIKLADQNGIAIVGYKE